MIEITDDCINRLSQLIRQKKPMETGGILVGTRLKNRYSIKAIIDDGPNSLNTRNRFKKDFQYAQSELLRFYNESQGRWGYLGEWHSHPDGPLYPSPFDFRAISEISESLKGSNIRPLLLIGDIKNNELKFGIFTLNKQNGLHTLRLPVITN